MSQTLKRILRLREQSEELRRVELQREALILRHMEDSLAARKDESRSSRDEAFDSLVNRDGVGWNLAQMSLDLVEWRLSILALEIPPQLKKVNEIRNRFLESRQEKRQVEQLIEADAAASSKIEARHQQGALDDWYEKSKKRKAISRK